MVNKATHKPTLTLLVQTDELSVLSNQIKEQLDKLQDDADALVEKAVGEMMSSASQLPDQTSSVIQQILELENRLQSELGAAQQVLKQDLGAACPRR